MGVSRLLHSFEKVVAGVDAELSGAGDVGDCAVAVAAAETGISAIEICCAESRLDFNGARECVDSVAIRPHA